jgi:carbon-monoxide dehydrogenase small subunit
MSEKHTITLTVNGVTHTAEAEPRMHLGDFLRLELALTGTHLGCEHGVCGACTVLVGGEAVRSCLMLAVQADGARVTTIEGIAGADGSLHPLQAAFHAHHGLQCGFCTPGMIMSLAAYLRDHPGAGAAELRDALSGNICRCTGYQAIIESGLAAARAMGGEAD